MPTNCVVCASNAPGDAGDRRADGVDRDQLPRHRHADRRHALFALADAAQAQAERRAHHRANDQKDQEHDAQAIEIRRAPAQTEAEHAENLAHLDARKPVDAAGDRRGLVGRLEQHQPDAQRDHQPGEILAANDQEAGDEAHHSGHDRGENEAAEGLAPAMLGEEARGVRTQTEERRVAERKMPRVAQDQIERQREQPGDENLAAEGEITGESEIADHRKQPEADLPGAPALAGESARRAHARLPTRPRGKMISITTITA